MQLSLDKNHQK